MDLKSFLDVLSPGHELWPRKAMTAKTGGQVQVNSLDELEALVELSGYLDCFIQTHSDNLKARNILTVIFIDINFKSDLERARKVYQRVLVHIRNKYFIEDLYSQFSGFKGYHILIPIKPVVCPEPKAFLKFMQAKLSKGYCDPQILGDVVRLVRLFWTINGKALGAGKEGVVKPIHEWCGESYEPTLLWEEYKMAKISETLTGRNRSASTGRIKGIRPEVQRLIDMLREGRNLSHEARLAILFELINAGWNNEEIMEVFSHAPDYNPMKTLYYIKHARQKGYKPFKCVNLQAILERSV